MTTFRQTSSGFSPLVQKNYLISTQLGWCRVFKISSSRFLQRLSQKTFLIATVSPVSAMVALNTTPNEPFPTIFSALYVKLYIFCYQLMFRPYHWFRLLRLSCLRDLLLLFGFFIGACCWELLLLLSGLGHAHSMQAAARRPTARVVVHMVLSKIVLNEDRLRLDYCCIFLNVPFDLKCGFLPLYFKKALLC